MGARTDFAKISNPLTIIGVFAGLTEVSAVMVLPHLEGKIATIFVLFIFSFAFFLVCLFFYTLNKNHMVLYSPSDYRSDESFFKVIEARKEAIISDIRKRVHKEKETTDAPTEKNVENHYVNEERGNYSTGNQANEAAVNSDQRAAENEISESIESKLTELAVLENLSREIKGWGRDKSNRDFSDDFLIIINTVNALYRHSDREKVATAAISILTLVDSKDHPVKMAEIQDLFWKPDNGLADRALEVLTSTGILKFDPIKKAYKRHDG